MKTRESRIEDGRAGCLQPAVGPHVTHAARREHCAPPGDRVARSALECDDSSPLSLDGGGGTSTGGVYAVSGTVGQPDTGTLCATSS